MRARRIFLICIYAFLLFIAALWGNKPIKYALLSLTVLIILSVLHAISYRFMINSSQIINIKKIVFKNEIFNIRINIRNRGLFIYPCFTLNFIKDDLIIYDDQCCYYSLLSFKRICIDTQQRALFRGKYKVGIESVAVFDHFGIMQIVKRNSTPVYVTIYPQIVDLDTFDEKGHITQDMQGNVSNNSDNYGELSDIREYQDTDSIRRVHWKLSARTENLMVKNSFSILGRESEIILDLTKGDGEYTHLEKAWREDRLVETALSVCKYMDASKFNYDLLYSTDNYCEEIGSLELNAFERVYTFLAEVEFNKTFNSFSFIDKINQKNFSGTNIYIFTMNLSEQIKLCAEEFIHLGHRVTIIYVVGSKGITEFLVNIKDSYRMIGINYLGIKPEDDIKLILESI